jgi:hypothetical protein
LGEVEKKEAADPRTFIQVGVAWDNLIEAGPFLLIPADKSGQRIALLSPGRFVPGIGGWNHTGSIPKACPERSWRVRFANIELTSRQTAKNAIAHCRAGLFWSGGLGKGFGGLGKGFGGPGKGSVPGMTPSDKMTWRARKPYAHTQFQEKSGKQSPRSPSIRTLFFLAGLFRCRTGTVEMRLFPRWKAGKQQKRL